jgi:DNA-binding transcriptional regulator YiaG
MMSIKDARLHALLTQRQVAELLGIPLRTIENWEGGKSTPPPYVERLIINELARISEKKSSE